MSIIEVKVPQLSESVSEASLLTWHKQVGQAVKEGENLIDIETDKVVLELPAIKSGVLVKIIKADGAKVGSEEVIAQIDTAAVAQAAAPAPAAAPAAVAPVAAAVAAPAVAKVSAQPAAVSPSAANWPVLWMLMRAACKVVDVAVWSPRKMSRVPRSNPQPEARRLLPHPRANVRNNAYR
jgi:pyruvate/2-oxoglutarate dehydrogenase complex dihydrolipoamide acyltransferase (E2) component